MVTLADVGELALIRRVSHALMAAGGPASPRGPGDDAAVLAGGTVVTTDVLVEGVHFRTDWSSAVDIGVKAAAANFADVAAMGARPTALLLALVAPGSTELDWLDELTQGLLAECERAGAHLVGGDVSDGPCLVLGVTALGQLDARAPVTRAGARVGDLIVVAGHLGWSGAGRRALAEGRDQDPYVRHHQRPQPPYELALKLAELPASAMIDCSDGAATDLQHLCSAGGVGIELNLTPDPGVEIQDVLVGGEDHCFLAAVPAASHLPDGVTVIGRVVVGDSVTIGGKPVGSGWEHHR